MIFKTYFYLPLSVIKGYCIFPVCGFCLEIIFPYFFELIKYIYLATADILSVILVKAFEKKGLLLIEN